MPNGTIEAPRLSSAASELMVTAVTVLDEHFGAPFQYLHADSLERAIAAEPSWQSPLLPEWLIPLAHRVASNGRVVVEPISDLLQAIVLPIRRGSRTELLAVGIFASRPPVAAENRDEIAAWVGQLGVEQVSFCQPGLLERLGQAALASLADRIQLRTRETELRQLASQLSRNYEEITLLHQLTRASQVSQGARELQDLTLSLLAELLPVRQLAYADARRESVSSVGESILSEHQCYELIDALGARTARDVIVENHVLTRGLPAELAAMRRLVCVPVVEGKELFGWLLALGTTDGSELGSVEASLMTAIGAILATHQTNVKLFGNIKDLFIGVVRALSSAIDAKDPYTCGHSERVARLARIVAQELGLAEDDRNRIYLSGLLHDVGKIGIRDSVLGKPGRLTPDELSHIQEHPRIGFEILSGVRQLKPVLAGVRNHHENYDGTGYPDGLSGEGIPLMARIVAVADAYDAMSSDRPYRKGMDRDQIERIFRQGAGKQWDERAVQALLRILQATDLQQAAQSERELIDGIPHSCDHGAETARHPLDLSKISRIMSLSASDGVL
jgi:HD-GYP domain-containing protein (c-di-GMP phosphodiesterase class II)